MYVKYSLVLYFALITLMKYKVFLDKANHVRESTSTLSVATIESIAVQAGELFYIIFSETNTWFFGVLRTRTRVSLDGLCFPVAHSK